MKILRSISMVLLVLASTMFISAGQRLSSARVPNLQTGKIIGVVVDVNNARIVGATIKIKNARLNREARSGEEGDFEVELPAGAYQMTVEQPGFRRFELSLVGVKANAREMVNVQMEVEEPRGLQKVK
jgi:uncharacterized protein (DUF58 family)